MYLFSFWYRVFSFAHSFVYLNFKAVEVWEFASSFCLRIISTKSVFSFVSELWIESRVTWTSALRVGIWIRISSAKGKCFSNGYKDMCVIFTLTIFEPPSWWWNKVICANKASLNWYTQRDIVNNLQSSSRLITFFMLV